LGFKAGINFFTLCSNNPVNFNDPDGLVKIPGVKGYLTKQAGKLSLKAARNRAVKDAWKLEQQMVKLTGKGSRDWNPAQVTELLETGKVTGYQGHHIFDVSRNPALAGSHRNIAFKQAGEEHLLTHGGNYANPTSGELIDRILGGQLSPIQLRSGRTIYEWGTTILTGGAAALEALDWLDPVSAFAKIMSPTEVGVGSDIIPSQYQSPGAGASGGYVLYPNKPNSNMMQRVYNK